MIRFLQDQGPLKKAILGGLLVIICGAMVITLIPGGLGSSLGIGGPGQGVVATVAGQEIRSDEVQRVARQILQQQFPRGGAQASMFLPYFVTQAREQLITQEVLVVQAEKMGLRASDEELRDELQHGQIGQILFPQGKFVGDEGYQSFVSSNGLTIPQFEALEKNFILIRKLQELVTSGATVTDLEVRQEFARRNTKVKFEYAVLRKEDIEKSIHPAEAELRAFYDRNKAAYNNAIPEKRKVRYVVIDSAKIDAPVSKDDLFAYYDQHREEFRVPDQVNVRHILIKTPLAGPDGKVDPKGVEEARKKAEDVLKQLKSGAKFDDLAKKYSDDPGSKASGGALGWIGKGRTVPEFEKAAFALPKGGTSDLVQSTYGFHIIRVEDKQEAHVKSLDEVKAQIEPIIKQQKTTQIADVQATALLAAARKGGLEAAAAAKGLQVVSTDFISRTDSLPGIGSSAPFLDAVFNQRDKAPADEVQIPQGFAIFEVTEIKPPATPTFEEIRSRVETEFRNERSGLLLSQKTQELSDRAKAEHDLKKAAREVGATVKTSDLVLPDGQVPEIGSMAGPAAVAFTMKVGEISGALNSGTSGAVLKILERQDPSEQEFAAQKDTIRDGVRQQKKQELFELFLTSLRTDMDKSGKIKLNQDEMKLLTRTQNSDEGE
ncbi:MAG: peptidylprolyl isomerase [Acidobacteria bacterium]|nr:peptidylprolyl isomerase [Acidobacteriota bacterium]